MNLNIRQFIISILFVFLSFFLFSFPVLATGEFTKSLEEAGTGSGHKIVTAKKSSAVVYGTIGNVIKTLLGLLGVVFIILIIYAGFTWMLARGNEAEAEKAKSTITNAIIGLALVLSAYAITALIGKYF